MGLVNDVFDEQRLDALPGDRAIGHVRYSTAGDTVAANAQPYLIDCHRGPIAVGHNGNLVERGACCATSWRRRAPSSSPPPTPR